MLSDFLTYVEDHFAGLGPYRTLRLCSGNEFRIARRLRALLSEASGREAQIDKRGPTVELPHLRGTGSRAYLRSTGEPLGVELSLNPADTLSQAREFYGNRDVLEAVRKLGDARGGKCARTFTSATWRPATSGAPVKSTLVRTSNCGKTASTTPTWCGGKTGMSTGDPSNKKVLRRARIAQNSTDNFSATRSNTATPRPGLAVTRRWEMTDAENLDQNRSFVGEVEEALRVAFTNPVGALRPRWPSHADTR